MNSILTPSDFESIHSQVESHEGLGSVELEFRLGTFIEKYDKTTSKKYHEFKPGLPFGDYKRLKDSLQKYPSVYTHTKDRYEEKKKDPSDKSPNKRQTTIVNENEDAIGVEYLSKTYPTHIDYITWSFRVGISRESIIDPVEAAGIKFGGYYRDKKRTSYKLGSLFQVDLTEVTGITPTGRANDDGTRYEVELEVINPSLIIRNNALLSKVFTDIMKTVQGTYNLYTYTEKYQVIDDFNSILGSTRRLYPGVVDQKQFFQARNIKMKDMVIGGLVPSHLTGATPPSPQIGQGPNYGTLYPNPVANNGTTYTVTVKAKGSRKFIFVHKSGLYFVSTPSGLNKILTADTVKQIDRHFGTIIEGEQILPEHLQPDLDAETKTMLSKKIYYLIYDCLSTGGGDSRVRDLSHPERRQYADAFTKTIANIDIFKFEIKEFLSFTTVDQFFSQVNICLGKKYNFQSDGLIFTPSNYKYDASIQNKSLRERSLALYPEILKWKSWDELTIDFRIRRQLGDDGIRFDLYMNEPGTSNEILFKGTKFWAFKPEDLIITDRLQSLPNGTIVEFKPVREGRHIRLEMAGVRTDKPVPNNVEIAHDIWSDIHDPVDEGIMRGQQFGLVFNYHNRCKKQIYNYVQTKQAKTVLSIGTGKGGDIGKWLHAGITHVVCVEPDNERRAELEQRFRTAPSIQYRIVPTFGQNFNAITQAVREFIPGGQVDVVEYMLSLSFFFGDNASLQSVLANIVYNLKVGGLFIAFTIDGAVVNQFFNNPSNRVVHANADGTSTLKSGFKQITFNMILAQQPKIFIHIPDSIVENQEEFLVNLELLSQGLVQYGIRKVSETPANTEQFLNKEERIFTLLYKSLIFQRLQ
jgi:hypothetical protein